jgi:zeaxanthin glucosyltransferase
MVALPVGYDQPGTAARIAHHGVGDFIHVDEELTAEGLTSLIRMVLQTPSYREKAREFQKIIADTNGLDLAADLIELSSAKLQNFEAGAIA